MNVRMQGAKCRPPFPKDRIDLLVYRVWPDDALDILHGQIGSIGSCFLPNLLDCNIYFGTHPEL